MKQPGIDLAQEHIESNSYMVAIQPSASATSDNQAKAIITLVQNFGQQANETGYDGKLQIGITDRPGRVIYMLDVSSKDAIAHQNDTEWLGQLLGKGQAFNDDTNNYDPYGNRYTPFPSGKGLLGSMLYPWLGFKLKYITRGQEVWYDPAQ